MSTKSSEGSAVRRQPIGVTCTVSVPRNAAGDLETGVRDRLGDADGVDTVEAVDLEGIRPGLNDLTVNVSASLLVDDTGDVGTRLEERFGVSDVEVELRTGPP
ncbi:hypothetical protein B4589_013230 [Halolamina sp. CBA1230]|uniref:hypothetical protein n=1 Tax=Halolamina sp. CBA1230 TaxID=1853690 RepID=UPI0009A1C724|nr:hypothetical protein [Halolamina sp. CBA1230]QKY21287.1 hypothetical protein B4589_013230 [Halolamina sp. CBA1230]